MGPVTGLSDCTYIYDGTFHGLMTVAYEVARGKVMPRTITADEPDAPLLFHEYIRIATDQKKAERVIDAISAKLPDLAYRRVLFCFLSDSPDAPRAIINYLTLGWRYGRLLDNLAVHEGVMPLHRLSEKVAREWHRMMGLVRFRLTAQGVYYAPIEPDHNVLPLLSPHFAERMARERWIIHDVGRNIASRYYRGEWEIVDCEIVDEAAYGDAELAWQKLWNGYCANIAIGHRKNKRLQRQFLPRRYWKQLVERIAD